MVCFARRRRRLEEGMVSGDIPHPDKGPDNDTLFARLPPQVGFKGAHCPFAGYGETPRGPFFLAASGEKKEQRFFGDTPKPRQGTPSPAPLLR